MNNQDPLEKSKSVGLDTSKLTKDDSVVPIYFPVSPLKLSLMSVCTFGIYEFYWFYKNWVFIKVNEQSETYPFTRAWLSIFYCFSFFKKVQASGKAVPDNSSIFPGFLAAGWILLTLFPVFILPESHWLVTFFSFIFLLPVLSVVETINESVAPSHHENRNFTIWNIFGVLFGGLYFTLILIGVFNPML